MERFTISLDEDLAREFDRLIAARGYGNRSEAVRDMLREQLERFREQYDGPGYCVANLSYVYNHHERGLAERLTAEQHEHHHLAVATLHAHLDHDQCMESVILKGNTQEVRAFAHAVIAEPGVRHGVLNLVSAEQGHEHQHAGGLRFRHTHIKPKN